MSFLIRKCGVCYLQNAAKQAGKTVLVECEDLCKQKLQELDVCICINNGSHMMQFFTQILNIQDTYYTKDKIVSFKREVKNEVLSYFQSRILLGDQALKDKLQNQLENTIKQQFSFFKQENKNKMVRKNLDN